MSEELPKVSDTSTQSPEWVSSAPVDKTASWSDSSRGPSIQTFSGRFLHLLDPRPYEFTVVDIAIGLSQTCRYAGQTAAFYSVAEHSWLVSQYAEPEDQLWALLHDASEAFIHDVTSPLKSVLPEYRAIEARLMAVIADKFGLQGGIPDAVKVLDRRIVKDERSILMQPTTWSAKYEAAEPLGAQLHLWKPTDAAEEWLDRLDWLIR